LRACIERSSLLALLMLSLSACAGPTFAPDAAPEYLVIHDQTPLYRYGPQQGGAPEAILRKNDRIRTLRHELGYSFVQSDDAQTGYVANEDLAPAPPVSRPVAEPAVERETPARLPTMEEPPLPKPDLEATPADAPAEIR
jgi:hypothetical protein